MVRMKYLYAHTTMAIVWRTTKRDIFGPTKKGYGENEASVIAIVSRMRPFKILSNKQRALSFGTLGIGSS